MTKEKEKLFNENLYLVEMMKNTFKGHNLGMNTLDDLYQVGCIGLMKAIEFGNSDAPQFKSYLTTSIWNAMLQEIESKKRFSDYEILPSGEYDDNGNDITTGIPKEALTKVVPNSASLDYSYLVEYLTERAKLAELRVQKGIKYLILHEVYGYKQQEIARMHKETNKRAVSAYISVAKSYFRKDEEFNAIFAQ